MRERWARYQQQWSEAGRADVGAAARSRRRSPQRLGARPYSLSALQQYASCPYRFLLSAIYRLAPREDAVPLQRLDPLTKGSLFHRVQAEFLRRAARRGSLPVRAADTRARPSTTLGETLFRVADEERARLAPAIRRVWDDEIAAMRARLVAVDAVDGGGSRRLGAAVVRVRLRAAPTRAAMPPAVRSRCGWTAASSCADRSIWWSATPTGVLRVTDHKTGRARWPERMIVAGGEVLQPMLYSLALEAATGETVVGGRLSFCTAAGEFTVIDVPLPRPRGGPVSRYSKSSIAASSTGMFAAVPKKGACAVVRLPAGLRSGRGIAHEREGRRTLSGPGRAEGDVVTDGTDTAARSGDRDRIQTDLDHSLHRRGCGRHRQDHRAGRRASCNVLATRAGARIEQIVAVTFTEKAAGELKLRLREELGACAPDAQRRRDGRGSRTRSPISKRRTSARFTASAPTCLRERPVEAGVDPQFQVLTEDQARDGCTTGVRRRGCRTSSTIRGEGVRRSLRRPARRNFGADVDEDGPVERLRRAGSRAASSGAIIRGRGGGTRSTARGEIDALRRARRAFAELSRGPAGTATPCYLDTRRRAHAVRARSATGWCPPTISTGSRRLLVDLASRPRLCADRGREAAPPTAAACTRAAMWARRAGAVRRARRASNARANADLAAALQIDLQDSLDAIRALKARDGRARLRRPAARDARPAARQRGRCAATFRTRFTHLFVDEFQDTDPLQAEILMLLSGAPDADRTSPCDWHDCARRGPARSSSSAIPKQSIYRFRRADVGMYRTTCVDWLGARGARLARALDELPRAPDIQRARERRVRAADAATPTTLQPALRAACAVGAIAPAISPRSWSLPVPRPYGVRNVTKAAIEKSLPDAVGAFVHWLLHDERLDGDRASRSRANGAGHGRSRATCASCSGAS